ncbi:MAG: hypothetical protein K2L01_07405 [Rikenellaceae bacterium]|nr:hypothetical protein [Rikenellaceae bacterium]
MYHNHKPIYMAVIAATLFSSCVSLRQYTELSQDKHRADSVNSARIEVLEERLRQLSSSRLALLRDTLRLSRQADSIRGCYLRLLRGSDSENAVVMSRLKDSRSRLAESGRRIDEQAETLGSVQRRLAEVRGELLDKELLLSRQEYLLNDKSVRLREATDKIESLTGVIDRYGDAAKRLLSAVEANDSTAVADALGELLSLSHESTINDCNDDKTGL